MAKGNNSFTFGPSLGGSKVTAGSFELIGFEELRQKLTLLPVKMQNQILRKSLRAAAKPILERAKQNAPVSSGNKELNSLASRTKALGAVLGATEKQQAKAAQRAVKQSIRESKKLGVDYPGQLRDSLKIRAMKRSRNGRIGVTIQSRAGDFKGREFYGAFQEYGTSKMPGKGFIRSAVDSEGQGALDIIVASVRAEHDKVKSYV